MTTNYKQLAEELYETINDVSDFIDYDKFPLRNAEKLNLVIKKYEEAKNRGTGRTTALYMKAITEALENPGKGVEFIDHYPHNWNSAESHAENISFIINKLGYNIVVQTKGQAQVYLYNWFGKRLTNENKQLTEYIKKVINSPDNVKLCVYDEDNNQKDLSNGIVNVMVEENQK
jgi:hypothetical protein